MNLNNRINPIVNMKTNVDNLNWLTNTCSSVFELSFLSSSRYRFLENEEVAIIDNAVIEKPVEIERNVEIESNAPPLSKFNFVENNNKAITETNINIRFLIVFIFDFGC